MATRNSTSKARAVRKKSASSRKDRLAVPDTIPHAVQDAIEAERTRLMTAHTLLSCAALSMDAEDIVFDGPHYFTVLELSRDLVNEAINNLEPMVLESACNHGDHPDDGFADDELAVVPRGQHRVREPITRYLIH